MDHTRSDDVRGMIDDLIARLTGLRERYGGEGSEEEAPQAAPVPEVPRAVPAAVSPTPALAPRRVTPLPRRASRAEWVRAWIAMFVVFFGLSAIVVGWFMLGIAETERAAAILLGVIGTVLGYYFGQRGTARAQELADEANAVRRALETRTEKFEEFRLRTQELQRKAELLEQIITAAETDEELARKLKAL